MTFHNTAETTPDEPEKYMKAVSSSRGASEISAIPGHL